MRPLLTHGQQAAGSSSGQSLGVSAAEVTFGRVASRRVWGTLIVGIGLPMGDAFARRTPDSHPLQTDRLVLRIVGTAATAANFAIVGILVARPAREATRRRDGLCPACGYDLCAATTDRCPECGETLASSPTT